MVTILLVCGPVVALALFLPFGWGRDITTGDVVLGAIMYLFTGFGVAVGLHRLFAHHSFKANRLLKIILAVAGSMALEGSMISWVAIHRRHHMFSDQEGDPHSPHRYGPGAMGTLKGFVWAHVGWLFATDATDAQRFAPDLRRDRDLVIVDRLFPVLAVGSLVIPFVVGWLLYGTLARRLGRLPLGRSDPHGPPAPRHLEHQLHLPHGGSAALRHVGPEHQLRPAGPGVVRRELAQLPPQLPRLGSPRGPPRPGRSWRPD